MKLALCQLCMQSLLATHVVSHTDHVCTINGYSGDTHDSDTKLHDLLIYIHSVFSM